MKKIISIIIMCALFFGCMYLTAFSETDNLLENGGFEKGDKTGFYMTEQLSIQRVTSDSAHSGSYGLCVSDRAGKYSSAMADITDIMARAGRGEFEFSLWIRAAEELTGKHKVMLTVSYALSGKTENSVSSRIINLSGEWQKVTLSKTLDIDFSETEHVWLYPRVEGPYNADFYIDDVSVIKYGELNGAARTDFTPRTPDKEPTDDLLYNGGFEINYWDGKKSEGEDDSLNFFEIYGPDNRPVFNKIYAHSGELGACITEREGMYSTFRYDATSLITKGGTGYYILSLWLKLDEEVDYNVDTQLVINYGKRGESASYRTSELIYLGTEWTKLSVAITVDFTPTYIWFYPQITGTSEDGDEFPSFCMDDMSLVKIGMFGNDELNNGSGGNDFEKDLIDVTGVEPVKGTVPTPRNRPETSTVGAIRWDAWFGNSTRTANVGSQVERTLSPAKYHFRAPFFSTVTDDGNIKLPEYTQKIFDREMEYAVDAGIDYFVYNWYNDEMRMAREYHLKSKYRTQVRACPLLTGNSSDETKYDVAQMLRSDACMTVFDGRPLMFYFASSVDAIKNDIQFFRSLCNKLGLPAPYSVVLNFNAKQAAWADAECFGYYAVPGSNGQSFASLAQAAESNWSGDLKSGLPFVLCVTSGWHNLPRFENPVTWGGPYTDDSWAEYATDEEIYRHVKNAFAFLAQKENRVSTILNTMLIYAWNEHDEGGWICPTLAVDENGAQLFNKDGTPAINTGRLESVKKAIAESRGGTISDTVPETSDDASSSPAETIGIPADTSDGNGGLKVWQTALIAACALILIAVAVTVTVIIKKKKS